MNKKIIPFFIVSLLLSSCQEGGISDAEMIKVMLERGDFFTCLEPCKTIRKGEDAAFDLILSKGASVLGVSYENYQLTEEGDSKVKLTLKEVTYPVVVTLQCSSDFLTYYANGGTVINSQNDYYTAPMYYAHLRENTSRGYSYLSRDGYILSGWNTQEDGLGTEVLLGSRMPYQTTEMYASWVKESDESLFTFALKGDEYYVSKYKGNEQNVAIPTYFNGKKVVGISQSAFIDKTIDNLYVSQYLTAIESNAFLNCSIDNFYFSDNLSSVKDTCFSNTVVHHLHINADVKPTYSATYFDAFTDKIDYLETIKDEKKIVLFSGSSTRYGYYSPLFEEAFPDYKAIDMGVFAYVNTKPQLDIITSFMKEDDVIINSPEFDFNAIDDQFFVDDDFDDRLFAFVEADYDLLTLIDVADYTDVFDNFSKFQANRKLMDKKEYYYSAKNYDDDMNVYDYDTYNVYGDMTLIRPGNETDSWLSQPLTDYTRDSITDSRVRCLNDMYSRLKTQGFDVYFTYAPKNYNCLTESSTPEARAQTELYLKNTLTVPMLVGMEDSLYPGTSFYLIDNHLSNDGAVIRTNQVIEGLKKHLL